MKKTIIGTLLAAAPLLAQAQNYTSQVWSPDNGDGTYTNPVINADYSDPDVCVDGIKLPVRARTAHTALTRPGELADSGPRSQLAI